MLDAVSTNAARSATATLGPAAEFSGVHKRFGQHVILDGIDLAIEHGKVTCILGPSGAGKSVLIKHLVGLLKPDAGQVRTLGMRVDDLHEHALLPIRRRVGYLFQLGALFDSMTVGQNVAAPLLAHSPMGPQERLARVREALNLVGMPGVESRMPTELSGGQQRRVAVARAMVLEPELMLFDEPTTGLDPKRSDLLSELILALNRARGLTMVVVTHDMACARKVADRWLLLGGGRIIADGAPDQIERTCCGEVSRFIHGQADEDDIQAIHEAFRKEA